LFLGSSDGKLKVVCLLDSHFLFTILSSLGYVLFPFHPSLALIWHLAVCVFLYSSSALLSSSLQPKRWRNHVPCSWSRCNECASQPRRPHCE